MRQTLAHFGKLRRLVESSCELLQIFTLLYSWKLFQSELPLQDPCPALALLQFLISNTGNMDKNKEYRVGRSAPVISARLTGLQWNLKTTKATSFIFTFIFELFYAHFLLAIDILRSVLGKTILACSHYSHRQKHLLKYCRKPSLHEKATNNKHCSPPGTLIRRR